MATVIDLASRRRAGWAIADQQPHRLRDSTRHHINYLGPSRIARVQDSGSRPIACAPTNSSWLNRTEARFTALRCFTLDGTDHPSHKEQGSMIRRYLLWRDKHARDGRLREVANRANVA